MVRQLVVFVENRPGTLADLANVFAKAGVNIRALQLEGSIDFGACRVHVSNLRKAEQALTEAGYQFQVGDAIIIEMSNEPGKLAEVAKKLSRAKINVESVFGTTSPDGIAEFVFMVDDAKKAKEVLGLKK